MPRLFNAVEGAAAALGDDIVEGAERLSDKLLGDEEAVHFHARQLIAAINAARANGYRVDARFTVEDLAAVAVSVTGAVSGAAGASTDAGSADVATS